MSFDACPTIIRMTLSTFCIRFVLSLSWTSSYTVQCSVLTFLAVAETHKKHVPIFNLCDVLCFPHLGLIMVTCLVKKERVLIGSD